ncbi:S26 family signal peptidase [Novosphingobium sp. Gsoil 351]|uniref:S26 family signal peptidase n=1 Tax=Novosphingobium sp. Gsoil 351 TaxID=2675225 RepID=UPI001E4DF39C|nr:S26 family signal peptidase [Novosphingobium sp. Gsoil 351]
MPEPTSLPLFAWAEAHPADADEARSRLPCGILVLAAASAIGALATLVWEPRAELVWNASASAPLGLYRVGVDAPLRRGDMVIAVFPTGARRLAARRGYLPAHIPAVKRIAAVPGDTVCATGPVISINGRRVVERRRRDAAGRPLPWWEGCTTVRPDQIFLLMADAAASFDGRYFGPSETASILGRAHPLCVR